MQLVQKVFLLVAFCALSFVVFKTGQDSIKRSIDVEEVTDVPKKVVEYNGPSTLTTKPINPNAPWIETISWSPRVFKYHNFLTQDECKQIVSIASKDLSRSKVVNDEGTNRVDEARTSYGVFMDKQYMMDSSLLRDVERRIAEWTQLPVQNGESYYVIRYQDGQQYKPHMDWFGDDEMGRKYTNGQGNRIATILTYLQSPEEGGETTFPSAGLEIKAKAGDAVLFWDLTPDNQPDQLTLHAGKPVLKGSKWCMTKWVREKAAYPYRWDEQLSEAELNKIKEQDEKYNAEKQKYI